MQGYDTSQEHYQTRMDHYNSGYDQPYPAPAPSSSSPTPAQPMPLSPLAPSPPQPSPVTVTVVRSVQQKSILDAYILGFPPLGLLGAHNFYLRRPGWGVLFLCTVGLFGLGWLFDYIRMPSLVARANKQIREGTVKNPKKSLPDAYQAWFPPLGLFGLHNFYLKRYCWAVLYLCSVGVFGIGWIIDGFRMKLLVDDYNKKYATTEDVESPRTANNDNPGTAVFSQQQQGYGTSAQSQYPLPEPPPSYMDALSEDQNQSFAAQTGPEYQAPQIPDKKY